VRYGSGRSGLSRPRRYGIVGAEPGLGFTVSYIGRRLLGPLSDVATVDFSSNKINNLSVGLSTPLRTRPCRVPLSLYKDVQFLSSTNHMSHGCTRYRDLTPNFSSTTALPFNTFCDGNMGLFTCVPLGGDKSSFLVAVKVDRSCARALARLRMQKADFTAEKSLKRVKLLSHV
jgi:hypothetical protein